MIRPLLLLFFTHFISILPLTAGDWIQIGEFSPGGAIGLSSNGEVLAQGYLPTNSVDVFEWNENSWQQIGNSISAADTSIINPSESDFGFSIELNDDGTVMLVGALNAYGEGFNGIGSVSSFKFLNGFWQKNGNDIFSTGDARPSIALNADGNIFAYGDASNGGGFPEYRGYVKVYQMTGNQWAQLGSDIIGEAAWDQSGTSISLSADGLTIAIGAPDNNAGVPHSRSGQVRVYHWSENEWQQLGNDIGGFYNNFRLGQKVKLSADGSMLAGSGAGGIKVYEYIENEWQQLGNTVPIVSIGADSFDFSADGTSLAVRQDNFIISIYHYLDNQWIQKGNSIDIGTLGWIYLREMSLNSDASRLAVNGGGWNGSVATSETVVFKEPSLEKPILDISTFYETIEGEDPMIINATPTDGYPINFTYQWYFNGFPVPSIFGGTNSAYTIDGSESSNGTWRVEVTNDAGTTSAEFEYRVFTDADGDGLSDYRESNILSTNPNLSDTDSDGLNDYDEVYTYLTDPNVYDSDSDGISDGSEVNTYSSDPLNTDSDDDGLLDGAEVSTHSTDPIDADSDDDGLSDGVEISTHLTNPNSSDSDSDQLSDYTEINTHLTDPNDSDTDNDGLNDAIEINTYSSNPLSADTSGDGFDDGFIVGEGLNPTYDYSALRSSTISNVVSNSEAYGLYALDDIKDLRPGSTVIEVSGSQATVQLQMEESSDLQTWEDKGDPATMTIPADTDTKFFRFKMAE